MKDNVLKKEFQKRDVERLRNLVKGKHGDRTTVGIGYNGETQEEHKEGDVWEENGKKWTIKNGLKQTLTRFDELKQVVVLPLTCPKCGKHMKSFHVNKIMWSIHRMCLDCVVSMETKLKREGKYEEYSKNMIKNGIRVHTKEMEDLLLELALNSSDESFVTEAGDIEVWKGNDEARQRIIQELQEYIEKLKDITSS